MGIENDRLVTGSDLSGIIMGPMTDYAKITGIDISKIPTEFKYSRHDAQLKTLIDRIAAILRDGIIIKNGEKIPLKEIELLSLIQELQRIKEEVRKGLNNFLDQEEKTIEIDNIGVNVMNKYDPTEIIGALVLTEKVMIFQGGVRKQFLNVLTKKMSVQSCATFWSLFTNGAIGEVN